MMFQIEMIEGTGTRRGRFALAINEYLNGSVETQFIGRALRYVTEGITLDL